MKNMKNMRNRIKKVTAVGLVAGMLVASVVSAPKQAEATDAVYSTTVICKPYTETEVKSYRTNGNTAPFESGYLFGGWFREATEEDTNRESLTFNSEAAFYAPLTAEDMTSMLSDSTEDTLYAKFVPAQVLSVKAQNSLNVQNEDDAKAISKDNPMYTRVISSLDSTNYEKWGFEIYVANKTKVLSKTGGECETTKCYNGVLVGDTGSDERSAESIFGTPSKYAFVWQLNKISYYSNVSKIIYVRPYWHTMDGTKVLGLAKYVHIEDEYLDYISVPVNIQSVKDIAAGTVNMSYDYGELELISNDENKYFEAGRVLPEMKVNHSTTNKTFSMVGNATEVDEYNNTETIYANIRFKKPTTATTLNFNMTLGEFCDWKEDKVGNENVKVWDIAYEIEEPTN